MEEGFDDRAGRLGPPFVHFHSEFLSSTLGNDFHEPGVQGQMGAKLCNASTTFLVSPWSPKTLKLW